MARPVTIGSTARPSANALLAAAALCLTTALRSPAQSNSPVEYVVALREPQTQMVEMMMTVRGVAGPTLEVMLPVWRPGRYALVEASGTVRDVRARTPGGAALSCEKIDKSAWRVGAVAGATLEEGVVVEYRVYANSIGDRTRHVDDTHAFLSPAAVFVYAPELRDRPVRVSMDIPREWRVATGLTAVDRSANPRTFHADSYDVLADSPIEAGIQERLSFEVDGVPHEIAVWGAPPVGREDQRHRMPEDFARIVRAQAAIFGDVPYRRYVYLIHVSPVAGGGTEHLNSTIMQTAPATFETRDRYERFLRLVSHEMFHTWNVKQLRPAGLKPYDYQRENYTRLLWVAEGTTSYYEDVVLVRAGLLKPDEYIRSVASAIGAWRDRPGAGVQSLEESSFDAWVKFNRSTPDSVNSTVSFYDGGALASLALDMEVRRRSGNGASLDTVMRDLYRRFPLDGPGYTTEDVIGALERAAGGDFDEFFARHIAGVEPMDFEGALAVAGLELSRKQEPPKKDDADASASEEDGAGLAYIGVNVTARDGLAVVSSVGADGPAYAAGVIAGDAIVALNGRRVAGADLDSHLKRLRPGETVRLTLFRYDVLREIAFEAMERPKEKWSLTRVEEPSDMQRAVYESWLGKEWPARKKDDKDASP